MRDVMPEISPQVVVNRVRKKVIPGDPRVEIARALDRYVGVSAAAFLPSDPAGTDAALGAGKT
ncbi:MAG: hypothetical protein ACR2JQ_01035, partial [Mycobacteriales bacterium]